MDIIQIAILIVVVVGIVAIIQIILPRTGMPAWVANVLYIVLAIVVIVWLLRLLGGLTLVP